MEETFHILGISGSLRQGSYNTGLLRGAYELLPGGVSMRIYDLSPIPFYNRDVEAGGMPPSVQDFREQITAADALLIASPEYNHSVSGVLKNAIDWASRRSPGETHSVLYGKPVALMGAANSTYATVRGQEHLRDIAHAVNLQVLPRPVVLVSGAKDKFDKDGRLIDAETRKQIHDLLPVLVAFTLKLQEAQT